ncbi:MAG: branched-chain amino acid ABC transporter permease [Candidatus Verstraetearchaeota archaeon]|nr:branched-chain amino acid ABC transporter permease [Candidatus Verstraetearchaeota archaeon]
MFQTVINGVLMGMIFSLVASGLALIFGVMNVVNFAQGEFLMVGMYVTYLLSTTFSIDPLAAIPCALLAGFTLGLIVYYMLIKHLLRGPMIAQISGTFGLMLFLRFGALAIWGPEYRKIRTGILVGQSLSWGPVKVSLPLLASAIATVLAFLVLTWLLNKTKLGRALKATSLDPMVARLVGINTDRMRALAWGISGAAAGLAGALLANSYYVTPTVGMVFCTIAFAVVALGGFGSIEGAFWAGIIIGLVEFLAAQYVSPAYKLAFVYLVYFIVIMVRPQGLFGWE